MAVAFGEQRRKKEAMELLVSEIAKGEEDHVTASLRTAIERGWLRSFSDSLSDAKKRKDAEIERICSRHYSDFLNSVNEMLKMQGSVHNLKNLVKQVHQKFNTTGGDLVQALDNLNNIQKERDNTRRLLESALACKNVALLMTEANNQIESDDHYNAMRTIEQIQSELSNTHVKPMLSALETWLPITINKLLYSARSEADIFVFQLREQIPLIGNTIIVRQAKLSSSFESTNFDSMSTKGMTEDNSFYKLLPNQLSITLKHMLSNPSAFKLDNKWSNPISLENLVPTHFNKSLTNEGIEVVDYRLGDIAPLNKVLHLYAILGDINKYNDHYQHHRVEYFQRLMKTFEREVNTVGLLVAIPRYFENLVGFFLLEVVIRRMVEISFQNNSSSYVFNGGVMSPSINQDLEQLWQQAMQSLTQCTISMAITLTSSDDLIQIKEEMLLLLYVVSDESVGLNASSLIDCIISLWEMFEALQVQLLSKNTIDALDQCAYQPLYVKSYDVFQSIKNYHLDIIEWSNAANLDAASNNQVQRSPNKTLLNADKERVASKNLRNHLEANLDALEEEIITTSSSSNNNNNYTNNNTTNNTNRSPVPSQRSDMNNTMNTNGISSNNNNVNTSSSSFLAQTYPFSEFVCIVTKEIHGALIRLFAFADIKLPFDHHQFNVSAQQQANANATGSNNLAYDPATLSNQQQAQLMRKMIFLNYQSMQLTLSKVQFSQLLCHSIQSFYGAVTHLMTKALQKDGDETTLSKACQISIDSTTLALGCEAIWSIFENALQHIYGKDILIQDNQLFVDTYHQIIMNFRTLTSQAQDMMFELLSNKVSALLESLVFIDCEPTSIHAIYNHNSPINNIDNHHINLHASNEYFVHESVDSIINFLSSTFMWLTHLPQAVREAVHFTSCSKLAHGMLDFLLSNKVARLNVYCLVALDADCKKLMSFSDSCGIADLKLCFQELHDIIKLALCPDLNGIVDNINLRRQNFSQLNISKAIMLLEKISPSPITASSHGLPKFDKSNMKTLIKKLKQQVSKE